MTMKQVLDVEVLNIGLKWDLPPLVEFHGFNSIVHPNSRDVLVTNAVLRRMRS